MKMERKKPILMVLSLTIADALWPGFTPDLLSIVLWSQHKRKAMY
jgi:hypothetical protein